MRWYFEGQMWYEVVFVKSLRTIALYQINMALLPF